MFFVLLGKWPFWLSPRQVMVIPVGPVFNDYAHDVQKKLQSAGFCAEFDNDDSNTMNKKVRNAQIAQFNFIFGEVFFVELRTCSSLKKLLRI